MKTIKYVVFLFPRLVYVFVRARPRPLTERVKAWGKESLIKDGKYVACYRTAQALSSPFADLSALPNQ